MSKVVWLILCLILLFHCGTNELKKDITPQKSHKTYRKGHSAQHLLLIMIEKWKRVFDENMKVGAIFIDLSKAFDTLNPRLLLAKLKAYGLQPNALKQMENYRTNRFQKTKVNSYSSWSEIIAGVPQKSILGPLLFNIFLNLFLYPEERLSNFADDNTLYSIGDTTESVKKATILESFKIGFTKT